MLNATRPPLGIDVERLLQQLMPRHRRINNRRPEHTGRPVTPGPGGPRIPNPDKPNKKQNNNPDNNPTARHTPTAPP
ncbi:hypothetical protein Adu01nite_38140 [Paractinoplanes durhamensis]|uniref:Uncharacterized protein n=1 Tax=Paractinoplanes durhamensis TaxID=113563 RepID=A0ABQ3YY03_9ACTN|nr:hypothetical protein Adu01nite_38140 [Actinoplanes durhamensis]